MLFCPTELRKASDWTNWFKFNVTREGYVEQRFRYICKANVPDIRYLRVTSMKTDSRFCPANSDECTQTGRRYTSHDLKKSLHKHCHKVWRRLDRQKRKKENNVIDKEYKDTKPAKVRSENKKENEVLPLNDAQGLTEDEVFQGYCWCQDLGQLRFCRKCMLPSAGRSRRHP